MRLVLSLITGFVLFVLAAAAQAQSTMRLTIEGKGTVVIQLYADKAPKTVAHIAQLAKSGFYDQQRFHRVVKSPKPYQVQIGDPASKSGDIDRAGSGGSGARIPYEDTGLGNVTGAVGLSTIPGEKNTGDSQFYILLGNARFLDGSYTVFGKVIEGMDVVNKIEKGDRVTKVTISG